MALEAAAQTWRAELSRVNPMGVLPQMKILRQVVNCNEGRSLPRTPGYQSL